MKKKMYMVLAFIFIYASYYGFSNNFFVPSIKRNVEGTFLSILYLVASVNFMQKFYVIHKEQKK